MQFISSRAWGEEAVQSSIGMTSEIIQFIIASSSAHAWGGKLYKHRNDIGDFSVYNSLFFCPCMGREAIQIKHRNDIGDYSVAASFSVHAWGGKLYKSNIGNAVYSLAFYSLFFFPCMGRVSIQISLIQSRPLLLPVHREGSYTNQASE
jgi:hypothetical protein